MRKFYSIYVIMGGAVLAGIAWLIYQNIEEQQKNIEQTLLQYKAKFTQDERLTRAGAVSQDTYIAAKRLLLKDYYDKLQKLSEKEASVLDLDSEQKKFLLADKQKPPKEEQLQLRTEYIQYTQNAFERLFKKPYSPIWTMEQNGVRLDVVELKRAKQEGQEILEAHFIAWDMPENINFGSIQMEVWAENPEKPRSRVVKYKFEATNARPVLYVNHPEHFVHSFPTGVTLGFYRLQLVPADATQIDLSFSFQIPARIEKGEKEPTRLEIAFKQIPVNELWFMPAGQKFEPEKVEALDEERKEQKIP